MIQIQRERRWCDFGTVANSEWAFEERGEILMIVAKP